MERESVVVVIVGAGPAGLATSCCLNRKTIPNVVLEMEDCFAPLWKKHSYDRLNLHLAKNFCELPHMPFSSGAPTFVSKSGFIQYLDNYVTDLNKEVVPSKIKYNREVYSASFNINDGTWLVQVKDKSFESHRDEEYVAKFLVVATGENNQAFIPNTPGLESFGGEFLHSRQFKNGMKFENNDVLVVGCGNSGMEIAFDLSSYGAKTSIVIRNPVHVLTKEIVHLGMVLLKYVPLNVVDKMVVLLGRLNFGDLTKYGIQRPSQGPFNTKNITGKSPILDVGTIDKIKAGEIEVFPSIDKFDGNYIHFINGKIKKFDVIVFATGYRSSVRKWLKDDQSLFNENGMPKKSKPNHWKGDNGLYCAGFSSSGLTGISNDAKMIAQDIALSLGLQIYE